MGGDAFRVYQLVDQAGDPVYYGLSNLPLRRIVEHARKAPGPWNGMQIISEQLPLAQAEALETSLIQQAISSGRTIWNVAPTSIPPSTPVQVPPTVQPTLSILNPKVYVAR